MSKLVNGMTFHDETPDKLCYVIASLADNHRSRRVRVFYGDVETGKHWNEEYGVIGYIGKTTGNHSPIMVYNRRCYGGSLLLDHCILKLVDVSGFRLYQIGNYVSPDIKQDGLQVYSNGELYANCKTEREAEKLADYLLGNRMTLSGK